MLPVATYFKETVLLFNVHLVIFSFFVDSILCQTDKYISKVNNKKIRSICWMCSKLKINTAWHHSGVFVADFDHTTFNFKQVFVSMVWKISHNVLKIQKAIYLFCTKSCKYSFIQEFIIASNWKKLWTYDQCFSSKFALGIPSVLSLFRSVIWSAISSLFARDLIFFALSNRKPI